MKRGLLLSIGTLAGAIGMCSGTSLAGVTPMNYEFTYQGRLDVAGVPFNGTAQFEFRIFDSLVGAGAPAPAPAVITVPAVAVVQGIFTVSLNFGATAFVGDQRFIEVRADTTLPYGDVYTTLTPRRLLTATPYAAFALGVNGATITGLNASNLATGTVPSARISGGYANAVNFSNAGNLFTGTFTGSGAALTTLNATNISSGTVADARLSANVDLLNVAQTFTAAKTFNADLLFGNDDVSLIFSATVLPNSPMIDMFAAGTGNADRMVIGHSPGFPEWGMKYQDSTDTFRFQSSNAGVASLAVQLAGNVGVGTDAPVNALHVERGVSGSTPLVLLSNTLDAPSALNLATGFETWQIGQNQSPDGGGLDDFYIYNVDSGATRLMIDAGGTGNVGIGTLAPVSKLQVVGDITLQSTGGFSAVGRLRNAGDMEFHKNIDSLTSDVSWFRWFSEQGSLEQMRIHSGDEASIAGDGTFTSNGIDYAEAFKALADLEPGDVVSLAVGQWEHATRSPAAYDPHIIGVVSTKPAFCAGMSFDQEESINPGLTAQRNAARVAGNSELERELTDQMIAEVKQAYRPIALAGRVPCKVDGQYGAIKAGDRLTSSATPGCAMVQTQAGQSIGIALQDFSGGVGSIIVLVQPGWYGGAAAGGADPVAALLTPSATAAEAADLRARIDSLEALVNQLMRRGN